MGEHILLAIVLLLALYGCAELIRRAVLRILAPTKDCAGVLVIPVSGHRDDIEYVIRSAAAQCGWSRRQGRRALLLDKGMDEETRRIAEAICREVEVVSLCREEKIQEIAAGGLQ